MIKEAKISADGLYRYTLERTWERSKGIVAFVMLNPSTADASFDDHTIRKCIGFTKAWGFGGIVVVNLFAYRSTDPKALKAVEDPTGPYNHWHIKAETQKAARVVCAWGCSQHTKQLQGMMSLSIANISREKGLFCLGRAKDGTVRHPLMLSYTTPLELL